MSAWSDQENHDECLPIRQARIAACIAAERPDLALRPAWDQGLAWLEQATDGLDGDDERLAYDHTPLTAYHVFLYARSLGREEGRRQERAVQRARDARRRQRSWRAWRDLALATLAVAGDRLCGRNRTGG